MSTPADQLPGAGELNPAIFDIEDNWINEIGLESITGEEPPKGTDGRAGDAGAGAVKPDAGKETPDDKKTAKAGAKDDVDEDEDDEDRAIKAAPEEHQETLKQTRKAANFEKSFINPGKTPKEVAEYMKGLSKDRYGLIAGEVVRDRLSDLKTFFDKDLDDATFEKIYAECVKRDPGWVVERMTGKKMSLADIKEKLETEGGGKPSPLVTALLDGLPDLDSTDEHGEVNMEALEQDWPEVADYLKAVKRAKGDDGLPKVFSKKVTAVEEENKRLKAELEAAKNGKPETKTAKADDKAPTGDDEISPEAPKVQKAVNEDLGDYIEAHALSKDGLDLAVTDKERESAPEVADLKDTKLEAWVFGSTAKKIPSFAAGFWDHFKDNEKFREVAKPVIYYTKRGETENAVAASKKLRKYVDAYRKIRIDLPYFKSLDRLIERAAKDAGQYKRVEQQVSGGGSRTSSPGSKADESDDDIVNGWNMA